MSLSQSFHQHLSQKLSPAQIQLMQLIQIPALNLEGRIHEELAINPALEIIDKTAAPDRDEPETSVYDEVPPEDESYLNADTGLDMLKDDDGYGRDAYYESYGDEQKTDIFTLKKDRETFYDVLMKQLDMQVLDNRAYQIAQYVIGNIDEDGYLRRTAIEMSDDLAFKENMIVDEREIQDLIQLIQTFEPAGVGAYDLQECLILQLDQKEKKDVLDKKALEILRKSFPEFSKKNFDKIREKHQLDEDELKLVMDVITSLSPKPGWSVDNSSEIADSGQIIYPDFIILNEQGVLTVLLNDKNIPQLRIAPDFEAMLEQLESVPQKKNQEAVQFMKENIHAARWFMEAIQQRKYTLLKTMEAIVQLQKDFFLSGNSADLKPMILKDIADIIQMDISTVSRVSNSKFVQTAFGIYPLKYFFSYAHVADDGKEVARTEVLRQLQEIVDAEDKRNPLSDQALAELMSERGFTVARRTVAKYRNQLQISKANMRKEI